MTKDQKALTAAKTLYEGFISIFGAPKRILTDQGKAFTSEVVEQLCSHFRIVSQLPLHIIPKEMIRWNEPTRPLEG